MSREQTPVVRTVSLNDLKPIEMAMLFAEYTSEQQAEFFTLLGGMVRAWSGTGWCSQAASISDLLDREGDELILKLADHVAHRTGWEPSK